MKYYSPNMGGIVLNRKPYLPKTFDFGLNFNSFMRPVMDMEREVVSSPCFDRPPP